MADAVPAKPWAVYAQGRSNFLGVRGWSVVLFCEPSHTTAEIRRGTALALRAQLPPDGDYGAVKRWEQSFVSNYAQVLVPGSDPEHLTAHPLNRPFRVNGAFSGSDVVEIVRLVREGSGPSSFLRGLGAVGRAGDPPIERNWPIVLLTRDPRAENTARVSLVGRTANEDSGQSVFLQRTTAGWSVDRVGGWVSD